jgi:hypothetical protein
VSHVVFSSTPRASIRHPDFSHCLASLFAETSNRAMLSGLDSLNGNRDFGPPLSSCPRRAVLGVYRI